MGRDEVDEFYPKKPFFERHEFVGTLFKGDKSAPDLQVVIQYSLIEEGEIIAKVVGNVDTFKKIQSVIHSAGPRLKLSTKDTQSSVFSFSSDNALIGGIISKPYFGTDMSYKVADLRFLDLTMRKKIPLTDKEERYLVFYLAGPRTLWTTFETGEVSFTGEEKIDVHGTKIELDEQFPFEIETRPWYFYDTSPSEKHVNLKTKIQALSFKATVPTSELSDDDFVALASSVADDLTLLISFLSRHWVMWFRYELDSQDGMRAFIRNIRKCSSEDVEYYDSVVPFDHARNFLKVAFGEIRKLRQTGINLHMPLVYYISACGKEFIEEGFSTLFLSLEKIKDMFSMKQNLLEIIKPAKFSKLSHSVRDVIRRELGDDQSFELMSAKLSELNRPSLRSVLDSLFERYGVKWDDLYPINSLFTLIKTRDILFHSSDLIDVNILAKEELRLRSLLERLMLSMLGWKDSSHSPAYYEKKWLLEK
ncbi:MAG TPA: hypothetical protein VLX91_01345 [Candidatus Acidoferrales bacterium]|nr:hypothetical protein [Candidatus Acidoferrales bacterium]